MLRRVIYTLGVLIFSTAAGFSQELPIEQIQNLLRGNKAGLSVTQQEQIRAMFDKLNSGRTRTSGLPQVANNGQFTEIEYSLPDNVETVDWIDYDRDGDDDILLTGGRLAVIYRNDNGSILNINANLVPVSSSAVAVGDIDNDGDPDIVLTGKDNNGNLVSRVYRNNNGIFVDMVAGLVGVREGAVDLGDYDNDGDRDILLTGNTSLNDSLPQPIIKVYRNNGNNFQDISANLPGVRLGSANWVDYNRDGRLDIMITGEDATGAPITKLYRNNSDNFVEDPVAATLPGVKGEFGNSSSSNWADYDRDGDSDLLITGQTIIASKPEVISRVYQNVNSGSSFVDLNLGLPGMEGGNSV